MPRNSKQIGPKSAIPSVDEILRTGAGSRVENECGLYAASRMARAGAAEIRQLVNDGSDRAEIVKLIENELMSKLAGTKTRRLRRVINATGVIIHTNLGRSALSENAVDAIVQSASGYCNVELDLE